LRTGFLISETSPDQRRVRKRKRKRKEDSEFCFRDYVQFFSLFPHQSTQILLVTVLRLFPPLVSLPFETLNPLPSSKNSRFAAKGSLSATELQNWICLTYLQLSEVCLPTHFLEVEFWISGESKEMKDLSWLFDGPGFI